jgi:hypothetical protein
LEKKEHGKEFLFLQDLGSNSPGFLELESQKKGTQKGMHNLAGNLIGRKRFICASRQKDPPYQEYYLGFRL